MPRILIPTRNRPTSLAGVLGYLARFYPGQSVVIADGSAPHHLVQTRQNIDHYSSSLDLAYLEYPHEVGLFDRLLDVLSQYDDDCFVMGSDDDYPLMEIFDRGLRFLDKNPDYVSYIGASVNLHRLVPEEYRVSLDHSRSIAAENANQRLRMYAKWSFPTTYALTRKSVLEHRYQKMREYMQANLVDFMIGCYELLQGKIKGCDDFGFFCTRNYQHSFWRADDPLLFLQESDRVLAVKDSIASELVSVHGDDPEESDRFAKVLIRMKIREIVGEAAPDSITFRQSKLYSQRQIQVQLRNFNDLFEPDTEIREQYLDRLVYINEAIEKAIASNDNEGEPHRYQSLDAIVTGQ